ncbi:MAG: hypothetical protein LBI64_03480, partial [Coriobacteriales bacterium]|nr:hypothetical protein [Coriobacteriales bacterium]
MITKLVLSERGYASAERQTKDIDANWVGAPPSMSRLYHYGEIGIRGVLPTEILADKISVLSGRHIFRRAKDIFDVYALA